MKSLDESELIAPCGMNCGVCMAYLRRKNRCHGCCGSDEDKPVTRVRCKIKTCEVFKKDKIRFCFECEKFPCDVLKHLDKRYRTNYNMSMIDNLVNIKETGIGDFIESEKARWTCPDCAGVICVHKHQCSSCGKEIKTHIE